MTNESIHRFGAGGQARLRSPRGGGRGWTLLVALGLLVCAVPALAAEIVEVRVGRHPTFTRVVFELDRAAGYRIERSDPSMEIAELIVSLEASSVPRSISKKKALIEQVDVEPDGRRSVARVRLAKEGLRLKEMILTNPPRIVLDLLSDAPAPSVAKTTPKPAPAPAPAADAEEQAFEDIVAGIEPETKPAEAPAPAPVEVEAVVEEEIAFEAPEPAPEPMAKPMPEPAPTEVASAEIVDDALDDAEAALFDEDPQTASADTSAEAVGDAEEIEANALDDAALALAEIETEAEIAPEAAPAPAPERSAQQPRTPRPMVAKTTDDEGGGWSTWAMAGGAVLLLASGAFFFLQRRRASSADADWDEEADEDAMGFGSGEASANPFDAQTEEQTLFGGADSAAASATNSDAPTVVDVPDEEKESESVVFDSEENDMDDMEVISREQVNESLGSPAMPPVAGGASDDMQAMFAEMTRRMEALEARCDELVDARDRLERQVAAQTEELRVQRAAIARTQRAVRNLGRGEESAEEQEATEPALREPTPE
ncbi:MAG: hypothetical protein AAGC67_14235 [Myxococcota bacterium]